LSTTLELLPALKFSQILLPIDVGKTLVLKISLIPNGINDNALFLFIKFVLIWSNTYSLLK
jgi:hypothetical protein